MSVCAGATVARFAVIIDLWKQGVSQLITPHSTLARDTQLTQRCQVTSAFAVPVDARPLSGAHRHRVWHDAPRTSNSLMVRRDGSTTSAIARQHELQLPLLLGLLDNQSYNHEQMDVFHLDLLLG